MGIFNIFKKKAEVAIILDNNNFYNGDLIKGKIVINPLDNFVLSD